jgi:hypothetical protein
MSDVINLKDRRNKKEVVSAENKAEAKEVDFEAIEAENRRKKERVEKERLELNNRLKKELKLTKKK